MAKKDETKDDNTEETVNQPAGAPLAPGEAPVTPSRETLSHQYQANSPAIVTNTMAGYPTDNAVQKLAAAQEEEKTGKKADKPISEAEWKNRTKLDVSDPNYINPSLEHHTVK